MCKIEKIERKGIKYQILQICPKLTSNHNTNETQYVLSYVYPKIHDQTLFLNNSHLESDPIILNIFPFS